ncbi:Carbohydrate Esterase Family 16 protein [Gigaspora rosea]|uniref:Carbohydrate Esterase Family 16 protein n=1 Tax=Gigaspora rosea TaxID=44941 RepID=A0A397VD68_9GLOM|nr:Carbohydrate Esterase Family 16 protein [Gigaspora rosea]CAG8694547.1 4487_t:CDS:2 [Gigaspora rosea]
MTIPISTIISFLLVLGFIIATIVSIVNFREKDWLKFNIVAFGDSLTDNGNQWRSTDGAMPSANLYYQGRWSDGPIWVDFVESTLAAKLIDKAFGGATTNKSLISQCYFDNINMPSVQEQIENILPNVSSFPPQTTFAIWTGFCDYMTIFERNLTITSEDIVSSIHNSIILLTSTGARKFLLLNMPPINRAPQYINYTNITILQNLIEAHNILLNQTVNDIRKTNRIQAGVFDVWGLIESFTQNPQQYGFSNVIDSCIQHNSNNTCQNPDKYLWWDAIHPTTKVHSLLAAEIIVYLKSPNGSCLYLTNCGYNFQ